jgi:hypothetical protein
VLEPHCPRFATRRCRGRWWDRKCREDPAYRAKLLEKAKATRRPRTAEQLARVRELRAIRSTKRGATA